MITYKSESNIIPEEWQIEKTCVYHNFNIVEVEKEHGEEKEIAFAYDVNEYTLNEYIELELDKNKASIRVLEDAVCELGEIIGG